MDQETVHIENLGSAKLAVQLPALPKGSKIINISDSFLKSFPSLKKTNVVKVNCVRVASTQLLHLPDSCRELVMDDCFLRAEGQGLVRLTIYSRLSPGFGKIQPKLSYPSLQTLECFDVPIETFDLGSWPELRSLTLVSTGLTSILIPENHPIESLTLIGGNFRDIDVSNAARLVHLDLRDNGLKEIHGLDNLSGLSYFNCSYNKLKKICLRRLVALGEVRMVSNKIRQLEVPIGSVLRTISHDDNVYTEFIQ